MSDHGGRKVIPQGRNHTPALKVSARHYFRRSLFSRGPDSGYRRRRHLWSIYSSAIVEDGTSSVPHHAGPLVQTEYPPSTRMVCPVT